MIEKRITRAIESGNENRIREVLADVYARYARLVLFIIGKYVRSSHDAEDLTEDVFVSCFEAMLSGTRVDNIKYYLTSTAKNKALNYLSRERNKAKLGEQGVLLDPTYDPEEGLISSCAYDELIRELRGYLSERELSIIIARSINGESFSEIAKTHGISQNAVTIKYHRVIKKIRKYGGKGL